jgi:pimeloyl-ACP methyl ester carboxylesterase
MAQGVHAMSLYTLEAGNTEGSAIVFLHAIGTSGWMWQGQVDQLSDYHCLIPDLPGHGQSHAEPWRSLTDTAKTVADIIRTRTRTGRAHVVGLSLGSYVAMELMSTAPETVDHAVLSGLNVLPFPNQALMNLMGYCLVPFIKTGFMARLNARALRMPPEAFTEYRRNQRLMSRTAYLRASGDAAMFRLSPNIAGVRCPTLVVAGQREHPLIHQSLQAIVTTMPTATARVAPDVGHGWSGENPSLFNQMLRAWIADRSLPEALLPLSPVAQHGAAVPTV